MQFNVLKPESIIDLEQKDLAFLSTLIPLFVAILCAEPRHIRISTSIGAKGWYFAFLPSFKKEKIVIRVSFKRLTLCRIL
jgi:hypothetical protein